MGIIGRFKQARLVYGLKHNRVITQKEVAELLGITRQTLSQIEHGKALPRMDTLNKACKVFGVQPGDLLEYVED